MSQPYSGYAKALLERQSYPDLRMYPGGPPQRPYDVTAHTLPLLMGVDVRTLSRPFAPAGAVSPAIERPGRLSASDSESWMAVNRIWRSGGAVWRDTVSGDFASSSPGAGWKRLQRPRVGLYQSFMPEMDEGWTRWLLEQFGFEYSTVRNQDITVGDLRQRFRHPRISRSELELDRDRLQTRRDAAEYTGGLGSKGAAALKEFAGKGGTLIFLNRSTAYAVGQLGVKAKDVTQDVSNREFYSPGSLLNAALDRQHPLSYGLPDNITIWSEASPAWETQETIVCHYPDSGLLASGWLLGESVIAKRAALVDARMGSGHVLLFGMRPQYRAQSYLTFKLFFNALVLQ